MIIHNCEQRSEKWFKLRCGKVTASNAHRLLTKAKRETYMYELIAEQVVGSLTQHLVSEAMQWGIDNEPDAAALYAQKSGYDVETVGFVESDELFAGCSPDLMIGHEGLAQIKCPTSKVHLEYCAHGPSSEIIAQMQFEMWICGAMWNDFVTYDPRFPDHMQIHVVRIPRDNAMIETLEKATKLILLEVSEYMMTYALNRKPLNLSNACEFVVEDETTKPVFDKAMYLTV